MLSLDEKMPRYFYQAKTFDGKVVHGNLEANTAQEVQVQLQNQKLLPLKILAASQVQGFISARRPNSSLGSFLEPGVGLKQLQVFTQQFSTLIHAGLPSSMPFKFSSVIYLNPRPFTVF